MATDISCLLASYSQVADDLKLLIEAASGCSCFFRPLGHLSIECLLMVCRRQLQKKWLKHGGKLTTELGKL
jgi:hypothetical protein